MKISLIVAMDEQRGIGNNNALLCHLPQDLKYFKEQTLGKPIIMGRKTFSSIGKALPGRQNIVLSKQNLMIEGVTIVNSLEQALVLVKDIPEVMIIGGSMLFEQSIPIADKIYMTIIHHKFKADVYFPELDISKWSCNKLHHKQKDDKNTYDMTFYTWNKKK